MPLDKNNELQEYMQSIKDLKVISRSEMDALFIRAKDNDEIAIEKIAYANLSIVLIEATKYQNQGLSLKHLVAAGIEGMKNAIRGTTTSDPSDEVFGKLFILASAHYIAESIQNSFLENLMNYNEY